MKTRELTAAEKQQICKMREKKNPVRSIAGKPGVSSTEVWNVLKKRQMTGVNKHRTGRPRKTTAVDDKKTVSAVEKGPKTTVGALTSSLQRAGVKVSQATVHRKLGEQNCSLRLEREARTTRKTRELTMEEKQQICKLREEKNSIRSIAEKLGVSSTAVWNVLKKRETTGGLVNKHRTGRPRKTTAVDDKQIISAVEEDPKTTVGDITSSLQKAGVKISQATVRRRLREQNYMYMGSPAKTKPLPQPAPIDQIHKEIH